MTPFKNKSEYLFQINRNELLLNFLRKVFKQDKTASAEDMQSFIDTFNTDEDLQSLYNKFEDKFKEICRDSWDWHYCDALAYSRDDIETEKSAGKDAEKIKEAEAEVEM